MGLSERMLEQAEEFCEIRYEDVKEVELEGKIKKVVTDGGNYEAKVIIISSGATHRKLDVPGEKNLPIGVFPIVQLVMALSILVLIFL